MARARGSECIASRYYMKMKENGGISSSRKALKRICTAAVFAAIVYIATAFLPRIPIGNGYVHIGDAAIYLCAAMMPAAFAAPAAAIGAGLADLTAGYAVYIPATVLIKALTVLAFSHGRGRLASRRNLCACIAAAIICVGGYFLWEVLVFSSLIAPIASVVGNLIQSVASAVLYFAAAYLLDRTGLGSRLA